MKVLIAYFSLSGNTAKIATTIYEEVLSQGYEVHLQEIGETTTADLNACDLVFLGSACHDSDLAVPAKGFLEGINQAPRFKLAGFATHATFTPERDERARELYESWAANCGKSFTRTCQEKQIAFLGYFGCQGAASPAIEEFIHNTIITDPEEWKTYVEELRKHPDEQDLLAAKQFASQMLAQY